MKTRKRIFISLCVTTGLMASAPLTARASVGTARTCAQVLLEAPSRDLQWELRVTPEQASHLWAIRHHSSRRRAAIQSKLDRVRARLERVSHAYAPRRLRHLRRQEASLTRQLQHERVQAVKRIVAVLTPWQRSRCAPWMVYPPARPRPWVATAWRPSPRRVHHSRRVVRKAPRSRVVHRHQAPRVVHRHRAPASRVVHRAPPRVGHAKHASKARRRHASSSSPHKGRRHHR